MSFLWKKKIMSNAIPLAVMIIFPDTLLVIVTAEGKLLDSQSFRGKGGGTDQRKGNHKSDMTMTLWNAMNAEALSILFEIVFTARLKMSSWTFTLHWLLVWGVMINMKCLVRHLVKELQKMVVKICCCSYLGWENINYRLRKVIHLILTRMPRKVIHYFILEMVKKQELKYWRYPSTMLARVTVVMNMDIVNNNISLLIGKFDMSKMSITADFSYHQVAINKNVFSYSIVDRGYPLFYENLPILPTPLFRILSNTHINIYFLTQPYKYILRPPAAGLNSSCLYYTK